MCEQVPTPTILVVVAVVVIDIKKLNQLQTIIEAYFKAKSSYHSDCYDRFRWP